jgi:hypothetical protein
MHACKDKRDVQQILYVRYIDIHKVATFFRTIRAYNNVFEDVLKLTHGFSFRPSYPPSLPMSTYGWPRVLRAFIRLLCSVAFGRTCTKSLLAGKNQRQPKDPKKKRFFAAMQSNSYLEFAFKENLMFAGFFRAFGQPAEICTGVTWGSVCPRSNPRSVLY